MRNRIAAFLYAILLLLLPAGCSDKGKGPPDDPIQERSVVWVDTVNAAAGTQVRLEVYAIVRSPVQGITLPLEFTGTGFGVDSVSFAGTILERVPLLNSVGIDDTSSASEITVSILRAYTKDNFIAPDSGVLAWISVRILESADPRTIEVDTATVGRSSLLFADTSAVGSVPLFTPGKIRVVPVP